MRAAEADATAREHRPVPICPMRLSTAPRHSPALTELPPFRAGWAQALCGRMSELQWMDSHGEQDSHTPPSTRPRIPDRHRVSNAHFQQHIIQNPADTQTQCREVLAAPRPRESGKRSPLSKSRKKKSLLSRAGATQHLPHRVTARAVPGSGKDPHPMGEGLGVQAA